MARRKRSRRRSNPAWWWFGGGAAVLLAAALIWIAVRPGSMPPAGSVVATLVGAEAPVLDFPDASGKRYRVPERGRPTVLIFHMGLH